MKEQTEKNSEDYFSEGEFLTWARLAKLNEIKVDGKTLRWDERQQNWIEL